MRVEGVSPRLAIVCLLPGREVSDMWWWLVVVACGGEVSPPCSTFSPWVSLWEEEYFPHVLLVKRVPHQSPLSVVLCTLHIYRGAPIESRTAYMGCFLLLGWGQEMPCQGSFFCGVGGHKMPTAILFLQPWASKPVHLPLPPVTVLFELLLALSLCLTGRSRKEWVCVILSDQKSSQCIFNAMDVCRQTTFLKGHSDICSLK